jgi:hypothetical protein
MCYDPPFTIPFFRAQRVAVLVERGAEADEGGLEGE